ncbi:hypothetical protein [Bacillus cereus]|uniref:hypothetical protein n=1 Tax=Bacillus cereus TaxID=1396 RepID=UPI0011A8AD59|nr:hypothetical protein [Bacillus cereus]
MDPKIELGLMQTIYKEIYNIITYNPGEGKKSVFEESNIFFQMVSLGQPINPKDFEGMATLSNPNGNLAKSESFANFIDPIPVISPIYNQTLKTVEGVYDDIMTAATVTEMSTSGATVINENHLIAPVDNVDSKLEEVLSTARSLLWEKNIVETNGMQNVLLKITDIYQKYIEYKAMYFNALALYKAVENKISQDENALNQLDTLQKNIDDSWKMWKDIFGPPVEFAFSAINKTVSSAPSLILARNKKLWEQTKRPSNITGGKSWHMSYAFPTNWYDPSANGFITIKFNSKNLVDNINSGLDQIVDNSGFLNGLWGIIGNSIDNKNREHFHVESENIAITLELGTVFIVRPWLDIKFLKSDSWSMEGYYKAGEISTGELKTATEKQSVMPLIPSAFIVAKNIKIEGEWGTKDQEIISKAVNGEISLGIGPFTISLGKEANSSPDLTQLSTRFNNGIIEVNGVQIIGWISQIVPFCPSK